MQPPRPPRPPRPPQRISRIFRPRRASEVPGRRRMLDLGQKGRRARVPPAIVRCPSEHRMCCQLAPPARYRARGCPPKWQSYERFCAPSTLQARSEPAQEAILLVSETRCAETKPAVLVESPKALVENPQATPAASVENPCTLCVIPRQSWRRSFCF